MHINTWPKKEDRPRLTIPHRFKCRITFRDRNQVASREKHQTRPEYLTLQDYHCGAALILMRNGIGHGSAHTPRSGLGAEFGVIISGNDFALHDADHPEPVARSRWRARLFTALSGLVLFVGIEICPADVTLLSQDNYRRNFAPEQYFVLLVGASGIKRTNRRRYLQQLSTLTIFLVVAVGVFILGRMYPFAIRSELGG